MSGRIKLLAVLGLAVLIAGPAWKASADANGFLYIKSSPENAAIKIDGKTHGPAPVSVSLPAGRHSVEASLELYQSLKQNVDVNEGEVTRVDFKLEKSSFWQRILPLEVSPKGTGKISIITDWPDAEIYLDGYKIRATTPATLKGIPDGSHSLILTSKGFAIQRQFSIDEKKTMVFHESFEQVKNNFSILRFGEIETALTREELAKKRRDLPAKIIVTLAVGQNSLEEQKPASIFWSESDIIAVAFQYRRTGSEEWKTSDLSMAEKEQDTFTLENGTYEVQILATHEKQPAGLWTSVIDSERRKIGGSKVLFKKDFKADKLYIFTITYDGASNLSYTVNEENLETWIE